MLAAPTEVRRDSAHRRLEESGREGSVVSTEVFHHVCEGVGGITAALPWLYVEKVR